MKLLDIQFRKALLITGAAALLSIGAALAGYFLNLRPVDGTDQAPVTFKVSKGDRPAEIASRLDREGLIRSRNAFLIYATLTGKRGQLQVGTYAFKPAFSAPRIAQMMASGEVDRARLVVTEGLRMTQIAAAAGRAGIRDLREALDGNYDYDFLESRPSGQGLEGYLFPDTYLITRDTGPAEVVKLMLENFDKRVTPELRQKLQRGGQLTLHQAVTLASMVEREAGRPEDMAQVAQVFLRRLQIGMKLDSDVTVQYAAGLEPNQEAETAAAINSLNSPYNTYKFAGLPPGPICSPGLAAMDAVINPAQTDYLYFLADRDGVTYFARTFEEHQANIRLYR